MSLSDAGFIGGCITLFFCCIISSSAGIGGGGINLPVLLLIFGYSFKTSVCLSLCVVLGNAMAQSAINLTRRHPTDARFPLIFWELIIVLLPAQMGGSNIGSILSTMFPESVLDILAFLVLAFATVVTGRKGLHKWHDESEHIRKNDSVRIADEDFADNNSTNEEVGSGSSNRRKDINISTSVNKSSNNTAVPPPLLWPIAVLRGIAVMWCAYTALMVTLVKVTKCSDAYIAVFIFLYVPLLGAIAYGIHHNTRIRNSSSSGVCGGSDGTTSALHHKTEEVAANDDEEEGSKFCINNSNNNDSSVSLLDDKGVINGTAATVGLLNPNHFNFRSDSYTLAGVACLIGVICTLLGVGGGELYGPLMLTYGVMPQVSSGTTSMMSFLNTVPSIIRYAVLGTINYKVGAILFVIGLLGGYIGRHTGLYIASAYGRPSVIIFALAGVLTLSASYYVYQLSTAEFDSELSSYC